MSAYFQAPGTIDLNDVRSLYRTIEVETSDYILGSIAVPGYANESEDVHVYIHVDGWVMAYYLAADLAAKIIDWQNYDSITITTKFENTLTMVAASLSITLPTVEYYDFHHPNATKSGISVTSQGLVDSTVGFGPHLGVQFANSNHTYLFSAAPAALQTLFGQVTDRVTFEFANSSREVGLTAVSAALDTLFDQVTDRVVFEFANSSRSYALNFPVAIINDTTSPQVTNISVTPVGSDMVEISWTTDEFANSLVKFGTSSGNYTKTISDPLYVKVHQVTLTGINAGTTYYYRVSGTDLSGNVVQSGEFSFTAETSIYLPAIMR